MDENYIINDIFIRLKKSQYSHIRIPFDEYLTKEECENDSPKIQKIRNIINKHLLYDTNQNGSITFSQNGLEIARKHNSWFEYLTFLASEQIRENEAYNANLKSSEATVDAANSARESLKESKKSHNASWVSAGTAVIAIAVSIIQYIKSDEISEKYNKAILQIDYLSKIQKEMQLHSKDMVDSSKIQLKKK